MQKGSFQWVLALMAVIFQFTAQLITASIVVDIAKYFNASASQTGLMLSSYYILYALMQVPAGAVVSRLSAKWSFVLGQLAFALSSLILLYAPSLVIAFLGRILMGLSLGCHYVSFAKFTERWMPAIYFGRLITLQELVVVVFQIIFNVSLVVSNSTQWQFVIGVLAVSSFALALIQMVFMRNPPEEDNQINTSISLHQLALVIKNMVKDRDLMIETLLASALFSFLTIVYGTWWPTFLHAARNVSIAHAVMSNQIIAVGMILGMGYLLSIAKRINVRDYLNRYAIGSMCSLMVVIWWPTMPNALLNIMMLIIGAFSSAYCLGFISLNHKPYPSTISVGFVNGSMLILAPILQSMISLISIAFHWLSGTTSTTVSVIEYQLDLSILPMIMLIIIGISYKYIDKKTV